MRTETPVGVTQRYPVRAQPSSHCNAVIVGPQAELSSAKPGLNDDDVAVIKVTRICEGLRNIEAHHETQRMPHPPGAEQPLSMRLTTNREWKKSTAYDLLMR